MIDARRYAIVLVTAPDLKIARRLAQLALAQGLVACANIVPAIESHYVWKGKTERSAEVLLLFKTTKSRLKPLESFIVKEHPYDTPEFVVVSLEKGNRRYLDWISKSCPPSAVRPRQAMSSEARRRSN